MSITLTALQKQRYDAAANWTAANPTLLAGEIGIESDTGKIKIGTGSAAWTALAYQAWATTPIPVNSGGTGQTTYTNGQLLIGNTTGNTLTKATLTAGSGVAITNSTGGITVAASNIANAQISASAEIAVSKLANGTARQLLQTDAAGTGVEFASNIDIPGTLDVTSAATFDNNVIIQGDLTVNGTTTTIDTANLAIEDKNIEIGKVTTPTDVTADGGGITLKGTTDKTINWIDATDAWTLSEHVNIASTKEYRIAGTKVLDATSLGSGVTGSSLTSVGTIGTGVWNSTAIDKTYLDATLVSTGDTGTVTSTMILDGTILDADINASAAIVDTKLATIATAGKVSNSATTAASANTLSAIVARDGSGNFSAGTITADLAGNASTVTTNANLTGDVTSVGNATSIAAGVIVDGDINASAAIADTKLATIATAGKVSNSATTADSANTASAIVARDASGNFTAGTITAALTGAASSNVLKAGDTMTGVLSVAAGTDALPGLAIAGDPDTGVFSAGANQLAIATNGVERVEFGTSEVVFNDGGADVDFRVEGDTEANLLFVDAGNGEVSFRDDVKIDSSGRLLVGTSTAVNVGGYGIADIQAYVQSGGAAASIAVINTGNNSNAPTLNLAKSRGGTSTIVNSGDGLGAIRFSGADGTDIETRAAEIICVVDGTPGANDMPGCLVFATTADGASSPTEQMCITSTGDLRFNSGFGSAGTAYGCRAWVSFNATGGVITVNGSGNVSSVTRNGAGDHTVNFSTAMPDANFAANATSGSGFTGHVQNLLTSSLNILTKAIATGTAGDAGQNHVSAFR